MKTKKSKIIKITTRELKELMAGVASEAIGAKMKELGMDKIDRKFGNIPSAFIGKTEDELQKMEKKERVGSFIRAVFQKDIATLGAFKALKAQSEGVGSEGGFSVPEEFQAEIARIAEDFGIVRRLARKIGMGSDTRNMPTLSSSVSVTYPGEGTAGTPSQFVEANVQLLAKTAVGLTVASNELLEDANVDIVEFLTELFAEALAGSEDEQGLTGTGAPFTGILGDAGVNVVDLGTGDVDFVDADLDDYRDMISKVKSLALGSAVYIVHREVWGDIQKKKDNDAAYHLASANPILTPGALEGAVGGNIVGTLWGYPVLVSDKMPDLAATAVSTKFALFGSLRFLWLGDRKQMTLAISDSATVGTDKVFEQNQSAVRVTERIAIAVGLPQAFSVLKTASV